jgi:FKBP-type peptidyl-prolyl cis-trans isomerase 2
MRSFFYLFGIALTFSGCTNTSFPPPSTTVNAGENITFEYTCKTADGKLAATSNKAVAETPSQMFSPLFAPLNNYLPASERVPTQQQTPPLHMKMCYEEMLERLIARQAPDKPFNTPLNISVDGELIPGISGGDRYLFLNRITKNKRLQTLSVSKFEGKFGATPVIGIKYDSPHQPGMSATVENMEGNNVVILNSAEPGTVLSSPFGRQIVTQTGDTLEFRTDAAIGGIIRSGGMIGKISKVDDQTIEIDYGHSSGFIPLTCEVVFQPFSSPDRLDWHVNLDQAKEESRQTGKPLLMHFHDQWSKPGRELLAKVLPDPKVVDALEGYVRVRINSINQPELAKQYEVITVPVIQLYDSQGNLMSTINDLPKVEDLIEELQKVEANVK